MVKSWLGKSRASRSYAVKMAANHALVLRTKDWKYIEPSKGGPMIPWGPKIETGYKPTPQLFRITEDQGEQTNVADRHPKLVRKFQEQIDALRQK